MSGFLINPYRFGRLWTPADITTALWLDAADASTITTVSGAVSEWRDKSGNARHLSQSASANRPAYTTAGQNGLNVVDFNGTTSFLERSQTNLSTNWTCVIAAKNDTIVPVNFVYVGQGSTTDPLPRWHLDRDGTNARTLRRNDAGTINAATQGTHSASAFIQASTNDGSLLGVSLNGASLSTASAVTGSFSTNRFTVGALYAGSTTPNASTFIDGPVFEVVYCPSMLATLDRQRIEGYLAHKWGLAGNLPSGHPYKSAAPTV